MLLRVLLRILASSALTFIFVSCVSSYTRMPSSALQVYSKNDIRQSLLLIAQNNILLHVPDTATREFEKAEVDQKCRQFSKPFWSEKLSDYLAEFKKYPELLSRFHVIELKRGDKPDVVVQRDLDGAVTLSIQFVKLENRKKITAATKIPCTSSVAGYLDRELVKTEYDFPSIENFILTLKKMPDKKDMARFQFLNNFLVYLAERGAVFKFSHDMSFERTSQGKYVMSELLNKLALDVKQPLYQHMNYWFKEINTSSTQAQFIQMFGLLQDKELKAGIRVDVKNEMTQKNFGEADLTYLFITYNVEDDRVKSVNLQQLEKCLQIFTGEMSGIKFRKPAGANDNKSYLRPGYNCAIEPENRVNTK